MAKGVNIAECCYEDEVLTFCSKYFDDDIETSFNHPRRIDDSPPGPSMSTLFPPIGKPV